MQKIFWGRIEDVGEEKHDFTVFEKYSLKQGCPTYGPQVGFKWPAMY